MKYALIADIHGNLTALDAVLSDAEEEGAESFIFLGDYCLGLAHPNEVVERIRGEKNVSAVSGNEDEGLVRERGRNRALQTDGQFSAVYWYARHLSKENLDFLASLPSEIKINCENTTPVFAIHKPEDWFPDTAERSAFGSAIRSQCSRTRASRARLAVEKLNPQLYAEEFERGAFDHETFPAYAKKLFEEDKRLAKLLDGMPDGAYVFGHKHIQWQWRYGKKLLVNPGSAGLPLDFNCDAPYALLVWENGRWQVELRRVKYDMSEALMQAKKSVSMQNAPVWCSVIARELETSREQALAFLHLAETIAVERGDATRPFSHEVWNAAFDVWKQ